MLCPWLRQLRSSTRRPPLTRRKSASLRLEALEDRTLLANPGSGTFAPPLTFGGASVPSLEVVGDFNGDGRLDLAITENLYPSGAAARVLLNYPDGTFAPQATFAVGNVPRGLVAGDFNGDGKLDLASANFATDPRNVSVLLGNGNGTFAPQTTFAAGHAAFALAAGDFNTDGKLDLAVASRFPDDVSVLLGTGNGAFSPGGAFAVGPDVRSLAVGDFNGDGKLDLAAGNNIYGPNLGGTVGVLLGNGNGSFAPQVTSATGQAPKSIAVGDFNGDAKLDVATTNSYPEPGTVSVLLGNGNGSFAPQSTVPAVLRPVGLALGDFNADGKLDLAVGNHDGGSQGNVGLLLGNGNGSFGPQVTFVSGSEALSVVAGDFTGDGKLDLTTRDYSNVTVMPGRGDGTFGPPDTVAGNPFPNSVAVGDFNGDGKPDLATANTKSPFGRVNVLLGTGSGTFGPPATFAAGPGPASVMAGDFNGDGKLDLAAAIGPGIGVLLGNGNGTFAPQATFATAGSALVAVGDFNRDGRLDLTAAGGDRVSVLLGNGNGTFGPQATFAIGPAVRSLSVGDFNGDGNLDLATANYGYPTGSVSVLLGNGNGTFVPQATFAAGRPLSVAVGDFNADGKPDLAVSNVIVTHGPRTSFVSPGGVNLLLGNGNGTFAAPATLATDLYPRWLALGDFNGDAKLDIAAANEQFGGYPGGSVGILLGHGNGTFGPQTNFVTGLRANAVAAGDFNGDGAPDLAFSSSSGLTAASVSVLLNQPRFALRVFVTGADAGGGPDVKVFDAATHQFVRSFFAYDAAFTGGVRVAAGDVNGDGFPDVITAAGPGGGPDVAVFSGQDGSRLFSFFAFDPNFTGGVTVAAGDVNADGFADIIVGADAGGGPNVSVFSGKDNAHTRLFSFFAYDPRFTGGVRVAGSDVNGDGFADIICGAGPGGGPNVTVFSGKDNAQLRLFSFFAFDPNFTNGIYVAGGDVNGDGHADIMAGAGAGGGPNVAVFNGLNAAIMSNFFAFASNFFGGVRIGAAIQASGLAALVAVEGPQTNPQAGPVSSPQVRIFDPISTALLDSFFAVDPLFTGGLYVAGNA